MRYVYDDRVDESRGTSERVGLFVERNEELENKPILEDLLVGVGVVAIFILMYSNRSEKRNKHSIFKYFYHFIFLNIYLNNFIFFAVNHLV